MSFQNKWYQLFVAAPEGNNLIDSKAVKQIHDHLVQTFGDDAYFTSPRPSSLPTRTPDGMWQVQVLDGQILSQVKAVIKQHGLTIIREVPHDDSHNPTIEELVNACRGILSDEECEEISRKPMKEAMGYVTAALLESDCEDPLGFLIQKGILEEGPTSEAG